ncbi:hypothetical protein QOT17_019285 [Balamuthia mandrillaris]
MKEMVGFSTSLSEFLGPYTVIYHNSEGAYLLQDNTGKTLSKTLLIHISKAHVVCLVMERADTPTKKEDGLPSFGDIDVNENRSKAALACLLKRKAQLSPAIVQAALTPVVKKRIKNVLMTYQKSELMEMINQLTAICKEESEPLFQLCLNLPSQLLVTCLRHAMDSATLISTFYFCCLISLEVLQE